MAFYKANHMIKYNGVWYQAGEKINVNEGDETLIENCGGYPVDGRRGTPKKNPPEENPSILKRRG